MKKVIVFLVLIIFLAQSCIFSLHPLYTKETITYDSKIEGKWSDGDVDSNDGPITWEFKRKQQGYELIRYSEDVDTLSYEATLVKLGDYLFLDLKKELEDDSMDDISFYLPTHNFAKVLFKENKLELVFFDDAYLEKLFKQRKIRLKHEVVDDTIVLTASSEELQKFIVKYANDPKAFMDGYVLNKI